MGESALGPGVSRRFDRCFTDSLALPGSASGWWTVPAPTGFAARLHTSGESAPQDNRFRPDPTHDCRRPLAGTVHHRLELHHRRLDQLLPRWRFAGALATCAPDRSTRGDRAPTRFGLLCV